ncbi:hypothetical protein BCR36DRAFT_366772 [Piromyces finnis]|uniref:Bromodomain-domain-containing protein n=1 Tax=Piromyces finnis TaxID=1754191 RepID=A0A1Y1VKE6_9FUNG|nr:hypothetical protein BCR36DRAFT_366772 [Piromyces finnis]|eukprot:ORX58554.1 hypothetical protein BCR36DRAFT_366772 [Piromyces finnis]
MSIEEEPTPINTNEKNETVDNQIKSIPEKTKIHLKNIKPNILSPPDTPQINLKKEINIPDKKSENSSEIIINIKNDISDSKVELNTNNIEIEENNSNDINKIENKENIIESDRNKSNQDLSENINENKEIIQKEKNNNNNTNINNNNNININNDKEKLNRENENNEKDESTKFVENESKDEIINNDSSKVQKADCNKVIVKVDNINKVNPNEKEKSHKMPRSEINICTDITRSLQLHPRSFPFLKPVDPVLLNIPDYLIIIKHPMDLSTIMAKIKNNKYKDINEYICDVQLMFNNCFTYNPPENPVHIAGLALNDYFIEQLRRLSPEVQASLKILNEDENNGLNIKDKRPKRQIKAVQHLEPEYHLPKKMKVVHKYTNEDTKEENLSKSLNDESNDKKEIIHLSKSKSIKSEEPNITTKTTIKKLIATTRATNILDSIKVKNKKNQIKNENDVEEDDVEEIDSEEQLEEGKSEIEDYEDEDEEEEDDDDDEFVENDADSLRRKTNSLIRASRKVLSRMKSKDSHSKIRKITTQTGSISKKSSKSKLFKSLTKIPTLTSDQIYSMDPVDDLVERQINNLTICLQNVTKQLELLQVQSKARQLKKKAKRLAKSLNINSYDYQSESDNIEELLNQTNLLTNNTNKLLKRRSSKSKLNKSYIPDVKELEEDDLEDEIQTSKKKSKISQKVIKKVNKRTIKTETKGRKRTQEISKENSYDIKRVCEYCGDTDTPMWRRGPNGKGTLCNKCGVKWKGGKIYQGEEIPIKMKNRINPPLKKERKTKTKAKGKNKEIGRGAKSKQPKVAEITYNQKKELSEMINYLSEEKISGVVDIIRSSIPDIKDSQEEIELDIETIDPATLYKLYNYVKKVSKPKCSKKKENKNEETSSDESSVESSDSEDETSDSDSEPNQFM